MHPHHSELLEEEYESDGDGEESKDEGEDKEAVGNIVIVTAVGAAEAAVRWLLFEVVKRWEKENKLSKYVSKTFINSM